MTLLFSDSCDLYGSIADIQAAGYITGTGTGVNTTGGRFGGGALSGNQDDQGFQRFIVSHGPAEPHNIVIVQYAYKVTTAHEILTDKILILNEGVNISCSLETVFGGAVRVLDRDNVIVGISNKSVIYPNKWNYIQFKALIDGGVVTKGVIKGDHPFIERDVREFDLAMNDEAYNSLRGAEVI